MKKKFKIASVVIAVILVLSVAFLGAEAYRLSKPENKGERPLITLDESYNERSIKYKGLGYTVTYLVDSKIDPENDTITTHNIYSAEVRLFDKVVVGAWIE